jgi:PilZ domain
VRRLRERQDVTLLVGTAQLRCRVVVVERDEAVLQPVETPRLSRHELEGACSLIFGHGGNVVALKGRVQWSEDLRFRVHDGVQLPQQRESHRLGIPLAVRVGTVSARTLDVSADGLSLEGGSFGAAGALLDLELDIPDNAPLMRCQGRIVRTSPKLTAVQFVDLPAESRERLARFVLAVQRMLVSGELQAS